MQCQAQRGVLEFSFAEHEDGMYMFHAHQSEFTELGWVRAFRRAGAGRMSEQSQPARSPMTRFLWVLIPLALMLGSFVWIAALDPLRGFNNSARRSRR